MALCELKATTESREDALEWLRWNCPHSSPREERVKVDVLGLWFKSRPEAYLGLLLVSSLAVPSEVTVMAAWVLGLCLGLFWERSDSPILQGG